MTYPYKVAEEYNRQERDEPHPYSPAYKLVVVPVDAADTPVTDLDQQVLGDGHRQANRSQLRLHGAADQWLVSLDRRLEEDDISDSYTERAKRSIDRLKELVRDQPLMPISKPHLEQIRRALESKKKKNGQLRKRSTIKTELGHVMAMFQWAEDNNLWGSFLNWQRWLRAVHRSDDNDDDADQERTIQSHTVSELKRIYALASRSCRLWIAMSLNFSWGAKEIATARKRHFKTASGERRVARYRHKRRPGAVPVPGRWIAWPETWELALDRMNKTTDDPNLNPKGYAFLTVQNQALVRYKRCEKSNKSKRYDVVDDAYKEACSKAGVRYVGFYAIRRTATDMMDEMFGEGVADLFSQHRPRSITKKHYTNKRWRRLFKALERLRTRLGPMFDVLPKDHDDDGTLEQDGESGISQVGTSRLKA